MDFETQFHQTFNSDNPTMALYDLLVGLRKQGISKTILMTKLEKLRSQVDEEKEDVILENLDFLTGFCSPHMRID